MASDKCSSSVPIYPSETQLEAHLVFTRTSSEIGDRPTLPFFCPNCNRSDPPDLENHTKRRDF